MKIAILTSLYAYKIHVKNKVLKDIIQSYWKIRTSVKTMHQRRTCLISAVPKAQWLTHYMLSQHLEK